MFSLFATPENLLVLEPSDTIPIYALTPEKFKVWESQHPEEAGWARQHSFAGQATVVVLIPSQKTYGQLACVLLGLGEEKDLASIGILSKKLPQGFYSLEFETNETLSLSYLFYVLGSYSFDVYKSSKLEKEPLQPLLKIESSEVRKDIERVAQAVFLVRDMVNCPAQDMHPETVQNLAEKMATHYQATHQSIVGEDLREHNFPLIHAVGRGSSYPPRLIELNWAPPSVATPQDLPLLTLVGKGVCFDTGGLDIKTASGMACMKKDMGGAACALALASLIMDAHLPLRLRVLLPTVENSISSCSYRPGDIIKSRQGLYVEVGNTDAEGRLILADALTFACENKPDLLIDFATLTGAARVALGPDLPAFFTPDDHLAAEVLQVCTQEQDPVWRLPLWKPYQAWLKNSTGDCNNIADNGYAGTIVAALFLQQFVNASISWMHFDLYAWKNQASPLCPKGGEAYTIRGLYRFLKARYRS